MTVQAVLALQRTAGNAATTATIRSGRLQRQTDAVLARHPAQQVLGKAQKWLAKRTMQSVSKHVALHLKANLEKRLHGVFRSPKKLRAMVEMSVREAAELAAKNAKAPADQVLEEGAVRLQRQLRKGKPGWLIEREFKKPIGTKGERFLRVALNQLGHVVTAFPAERLGAIGLTAGGAAAFTDATADAAEKMREHREHRAKREQDEEDAWISLPWEDFIPFIGQIHGGAIDGDLAAYQERSLFNRLVAEVVAEVEQGEQRSLGDEEWQAIAELMSYAISGAALAGMPAEGDDDPEGEDDTAAQHDLLEELQSVAGDGTELTSHAR